MHEACAPGFAAAGLGDGPRELPLGHSPGARLKLCCLPPCVYRPVSSWVYFQEKARSSSVGSVFFMLLIPPIFYRLKSCKSPATLLGCRARGMQVDTKIMFLIRERACDKLTVLFGPRGVASVPSYLISRAQGRGCPAFPIHCCLPDFNETALQEQIFSIRKLIFLSCPPEETRTRACFQFPPTPARAPF